MKFGKKFNALTVYEDFQLIDQQRKYKDFNTLGLYRSILENKNLTDNDRIAVRDHAHTVFRKSARSCDAKFAYS